MGKNDVNTVIMYECLLKENFTFKRREINASFMCRINKVSKQIMEQRHLAQQYGDQKDPEYLSGWQDTNIKMLLGVLMGERTNLKGLQLTEETQKKGNVSSQTVRAGMCPSVTQAELSQPMISDWHSVLKSSFWNGKGQLNLNPS